MPESVYYVSDSEQEEETPENSSDSESESEAGKPTDGGKTLPETVSEYEKQRLTRIAENRARMEALGLPKMASSMMGSVPKAKKKEHKGKGKAFGGDEDYEPSSSSGGDEDVGDDEDYLGEKSSGSSRKKSKGSKPKKALSLSSLSNEDYVDDDEALKQAIALSLQGKGGLPQCSDVVDCNIKERKGNNKIREDTGRKRKQSFASRLQMTEDELILHFFQFDERCSGGISIRDLERVATGHDFTWTDKELADMIHIFDNDGDGKLSLDEFRKIVVRCNMIKEPEQSSSAAAT